MNEARLLVSSTLCTLAILANSNDRPKRIALLSHLYIHLRFDMVIYDLQYFRTQQKTIEI